MGNQDLQEMSLKSDSSSSMSNKSSMSSASTYLKDENASIRIGIHNSSFSVIDHQAKNKSKSRKHKKYDFSFENLETVHNESIKEESRLQEVAIEDVEEAVMVAFD